MFKPFILNTTLVMVGWLFISSCGQKTEQATAAPSRSAKTTVTNSKPAKADNGKWIGHWVRRIWQADAWLDITATPNDSLVFALTSLDGGHTGEIEGKAYLHNSTAVFVGKEVAGCKLTMQLKGKSIIVEDNNTCIRYGGMGVEFSGTFVNSKVLPKEKEETLVSLDILTPGQDAVFRKLVDTDYKRFVICTEEIGDRTGEKYLDSFPAKVIASGVRGMYMYMEYVIMVDEHDHFWAAVLNNQKVYYYSNDKNYLDKLPNTIEDWRSRFKDYPVIFAKKE